MSSITMTDASPAPGSGIRFFNTARTATSLRFWNIGYSDEEADHWLVLETEAGKAWIAGIADARAFVASQHPASSPVRMVELPRIREEIRSALSQRPATIEHLGKTQKRQHEELQRVLAYCDAWRQA